jgi:Polyketide cyclase / dehydrase and lipid transport.
MPSVVERIDIPAPAEAVWETVRDFGAIDEYVPPITNAELSGEGVGAERTLILADGGQVVERLDAHDDAARTLRYSIVGGPLPVTDYEGTMSVEVLDDSSCEVTWGSDFDVTDAPENEVVSTFVELYATGLEGLKEQHTDS